MSSSTTVHLRPKKSLGQHFLRDENVARKIIAAINLQPSDTVLEIGPGEGALTKYLAPSVQNLTAVDIDARIIKRLEASFDATHTRFLNQDILTTDFAELGRGRPLRIVGNIPYNITSPIIFHVLDNRGHISDATLTMQREVALRIVAHPHTKDYGILSVFCQLFADVSLLFHISPNAFYPKPRVQSSVVRLTVLRAPRYTVSDEAFFRRMVRAIFGKRRKTLRNSLSYFLKDIDAEPPSSTDLTRRPEDLSVQELVALSNELYANVRLLSTS